MIRDCIVSWLYRRQLVPAPRYWYEARRQSDDSESNDLVASPEPPDRVVIAGRSVIRPSNYTDDMISPDPPATPEDTSPQVSMSLKDVLQALNDGRPVDVTDLELCVITGSDDERNPDYYGPFELGEIVVLGPSGREPFGLQRKPWKHYVTEAHFDNLSDALECQRQVRGKNE